MIETRVVADIREMDSYLQGWDSLAIARSEPFCSPVWMLSWWRHAAPKMSKLHLLFAISEGEVVGVAPFYVSSVLPGLRVGRILASRISGRVNLLARRGLETEIAAGFSSALASARCKALLFEGVPSDSPWPELLKQHWPTKADVPTDPHLTMPEPVLYTNRSAFDEWFDGKSANFRRQFRRQLRHLESSGASIRLVAQDDALESTIHELAVLHRRRWRHRGGDAVMKAEVEAMLIEVARRFGPGSERLRVWAIRDQNRKLIAADLLLSAGGETSGWLVGFDEAWADLQPGLVSIFVSIRDAFERGERVVSLGPGSQPMKLRFANDARSIVWTALVPRRIGLLTVDVVFFPMKARMWIARKVPSSWKAWIFRVQAALGRVRRGG